MKTTPTFAARQHPNQYSRSRMLASRARVAGVYRNDAQEVTLDLIQDREGMVLWLSARMSAEEALNLADALNGAAARIGTWSIG